MVQNVSRIICRHHFICELGNVSTISFFSFFNPLIKSLTQEQMFYLCLTATKFLWMKNKNQKRCAKKLFWWLGWDKIYYFFGQKVWYFLLNVSYCIVRLTVVEVNDVKCCFQNFFFQKKTFLCSNKEQIVKRSLHPLHSFTCFAYKIQNERFLHFHKVCVTAKTSYKTSKLDQRLMHQEEYYDFLCNLNACFSVEK